MTDIHDGVGKYRFISFNQFVHNTVSTNKHLLFNLVFLNFILLTIILCSYYILLDFYLNDLNNVHYHHLENTTPIIYIK